MQRVDYPLQALLQLREEIQQRREQELAGAIANEEPRLAALEAAERAIAGAGRAISVEREAQAQRRGPARAAELQRSASYLHHREGQLVGLRAQGEQCLERHQAAVEATRQARGRLAEALRRVEVIRRDFDQWTRAQREAAQRRAELELEELAMARRGARLGRP